MAVLPVIPNVFRCTWIYKAGTQTAANVTHWRDTVGGKTAFEAASIGTLVTDPMLASVTNEAHLVQGTAVPLDGSGTMAETAESNYATGQNTNQWSPALSTLVKLKTATRGAHSRGRVFLPFAAEGAYDGGIMEAVLATSISAAWNSFIGDMLIGEWELVIASYALAEAFPVTQAICERTAATQRRRQTRVRRSMGE